MAETEKPANPNSQNPPHPAAPATVTPPQNAPVPDPRVLPEGQTAPAGAEFSNPDSDSKPWDEAKDSAAHTGASGTSGAPPAVKAEEKHVKGKK